MDQTLSLEERNELMDLLQLTRAAWGNLSLMKKAYKTVSKIYHPDKGGNPEKMQRLNELFQKLQVTLLEIRSNCGSSSSQVAWYFWDENFRTLGAFLGEKFNQRIIGGYPDCITYNKPSCCCIVCLLKQQHKSTKINKKKPCLVWGECFCYKCYLLWFGFPEDFTSFNYWTLLMRNMDLSLLRLWTELGF
ncbi:small T antigen protein [Human polyomavirus IPPyV]|uniref:Gp5 protein n=2 Tax=Human polyomavirus 9 TaxID=943908 RepID=E9NQ92_9POLY|nr:small T antigen [Human polyomavirus 9]ADV15634.1 small T antigen [Human polyomavirus 9]AGO04556.1 small tumor antigen [Human polyomavirus 9]QCB66183.1 small T antigen [Human polyomavirus 9]CBZ41797.1 small T antigen protein [Human polyomavirus IPPyV]